MSADGPLTPLPRRCEYELALLQRHYRRLLERYKRSSTSENVRTIRISGREYTFTLLFSEAEMETFVREYVNPWLEEYGLTAKCYVKDRDEGDTIRSTDVLTVMLRLARV